MTVKRKVLITGGSSGIGTALVTRFVQEGHTVWFADNAGPEAARRVLDALPEHDVAAFHFEQGDPASHAALLRQLPGPVDILVNNAALGSKTVERVSDDPFTQDEVMMRVNALGVLWLTQSVLPGMIERGYGKVVFISSVGGGITQFRGFRHSDGMSKAAIAHLGRQLAAELSHEPVDVFTVCPGATDTPMFRASTLDPLASGEQEALKGRLPAGRLINPDEIAALCQFLCTDEARVLRGAVLDASLGLGVYPGALTSGHEEH